MVGAAEDAGVAVVLGAEEVSTVGAAVLEHLHLAKLLSVLLEAGSVLNGAFLRHHLVDQATLFYAPTELGPTALPFARGIASPFALEQSFLHLTKRSIGDDVCVEGMLSDPWSKLAQLG